MSDEQCQKRIASSCVLSSPHVLAGAAQYAWRCATRITRSRSWTSSTARAQRRLSGRRTAICGFVLFQRTQAAAALEVEKNTPDRAISEITRTRNDSRVHASYGREDEMETTHGAPSSTHRIEAPRVQDRRTIEEQLQPAIADED